MRFYTVEEAQAELSRVSELVELVRRHVAAAVDRTAGPPPHAEWVEAAVEELDEKGIVFRDATTGLIDFPSLGPDDRIRYLCWCPDDGDRLAWWHAPDEGFAGRKPL